MATHAPITGARRRATTTLPLFMLPRTRPGRMVRRAALFDRREVAAVIDGLIFLLDMRDGDPDLEPNGDELDASGAQEEDWGRGNFGAGDGYAGNPEDAERDGPAEWLA